MKKIVLVSLTVFTTLFIVIAVTKNKPAIGELNQENSGYTAIEKEKVIKFWKIYREATDYRMKGQWEQAADSYNQALELNGTHEDALYYMGNMYLELSRYKEAEEYWQKLAVVNPKNSRTFLQLGRLYLSSEEFFDIDKAEQSARESLKINKEETGPVLLLGEVSLIRGRLEDAAYYFDAVTASNFKSIDAYFLGGYVAWKKGDLNKARTLFLEAVKYSKPADKSPEKVIGEGDTKKGSGIGEVTSKSVFRKFITELRSIQTEHIDQALVKVYKDLDDLLEELKRRVH